MPICLKKKIKHAEQSGTRRLGFTLICLLTALMHFAAETGTAGSPEELFQDLPGSRWEIKADEVEYDSVNKIYIGRNGVVISRGSKRLSADFVRFDHRNMRAFAEGNVILTSGADIVSGARMDLDLNTETGVIYHASLFFKESHFYITGDEIRRIGKNDYQADRASLTSCDGENPAWKITAERLDITVEGYGTLQHGTLRAKGIPIFYTPWLLFPVKQKRQSGLLTPEMGYSDRKGAEYNQPLYWAIGESSDATFYYHYMSERGHKAGAEYRYVLGEQSKGVLMYDFLEDSRRDKTGEEGEEWGYDGDACDRPNRDRYWLRMKADQSLPAGFSSRLDLDIVSDQDYLNEFKNGHGGYDESRSRFYQYFGRDMDDYNDPVRKNSLSVRKNWNSFSFNGQVLWNDNVLKRRWKDSDNTLQQLPLLTLDAARQNIDGTPLFWKADNEYSYFYREDGARGHRADLHPRLFLPLRIKNYLFIEPSLGFRETLWYIDRFDEKDKTEEKTPHREVFDAELKLYSELFRIYSPGQGGGLPEKIKHSIRPQITYELVPDQNQDEYPYYDSLDRIEKRNRINLSLVQTLTSRNPTPSAAQKKDASVRENFQYQRFFRLELGQSYDFYDYDYDKPHYDYGSSDRSNPEEGRHLSPLYGRLDITPLHWFSVLADSEWSHGDKDFISYNTALSFRDQRGDSFFAEHRYTKNENESLYMRLHLRIFPFLSAYAAYERDLEMNEDLKQSLGLRYQAQCWTMNLRYSKEEDDRSFGFMVSLHGLGSVGSD